MMDNVALSSLVTLTSGGTPSKANSAFWGGAIPWLTPKDMNAFDGSTTDCVTSLALGNGTRLANADTIFIAVRGMSLHKEIRIVRARCAMAFNQDIKGMQPSGIDRDFLYFALQYRVPQLLESVEAAGHGTGVLPTERLSALQIPRFDPSEEQALGQFFAALDDKIELNRRMNETLEGMAQAVFRDWFVDFGPTRRKLAGVTDSALIMGGLIASAVHSAALAALFPATLADNGLPEGWVEREIGDLTEIVGGATPSTKSSEFWDGGIHQWATPKDLSRNRGIVLFETERRVTDAGLSSIGSGLSPARSVLMSSRAPIGYLAINDEPIAVNQGFIVMRPSKALPPEFAYIWCQENMEIIKANANGSTFQEISKRNFRPLLVKYPGERLMSEFVATVGPFFGLIQLRERESATLATTRDLLLPKLMSGEIRLGGVEAGGAT
jgi:type I restriction enzyme, S subunit